MEFQFNHYRSGGFVSNEYPDKQLPDSYPSTENPMIMPPMNPTPDVPGPDAPEVAPGSHANPGNDNDEAPAGDSEPA
jgi:hypothetical protein